jgi:hypothetical protein
MLSKDHGKLKQMIEYLEREFEVTIVPIEYYVGLHICWDRSANAITIDQTRYILHIIIRNGFADAHQVSTPFDANVKSNAVGDDEIEEDFTYQ